MRKTYPFLLLGLSAVFLAACGPTSTSSTEPGPGGSTPPVGEFDGTVHNQPGPSDFNLYFYSSESTYEERNYIWCWYSAGSSYGFQTSGDSTVIFEETGEDFPFIPAYIAWNVEYDTMGTWDFNTPNKMKFTGIDDPLMFDGILYRSADGSSQTQDLNFDASKAKPDENGRYNVYFYEGRGTYYDIADFPTLPIDRIVYSEKEGPAVNLTGSGLGEALGNFAIDEVCLVPYRYENGSKKEGTPIGFAETSVIQGGGTTASLVLDQPLDLTYKYEFRCLNPMTGEMETAGDLNFKPYYSSDAFEAKYMTDKALGAVIEGGNTAFRLYSPSATSATLNLYEGEKKNSYPMEKDANGVFEYVEQKNLGGTYYTFDVTNYGETEKDIPDPYAYSSNANGARSMVVDWDQVEKPAGFEKPFVPEVNYASTTIMEMQTRDFTADETWNGSEANRGKFLGLIEEGTSYEGKATGFDYIKELKAAGLTHVQIMPTYDFASVDETRLEDEEYNNLPYGGAYNWGYDPQQYNAPEGSFSSDPNDGYARVNEMREFVNAYNQIGLGVNMDVVYNHMPGKDSSTFNKIFPDYYFRTNSFSGAGSDVASERGMVCRFIIDSVTHYVEHYHMSGFRFDLMGLLDRPTMEEVRKAMDEIDPNIMVYGEGWSMFESDPDTDITAGGMATQNNIGTMKEDWVGAFNDTYRDGMKGSVFDGDGTGYVQEAYQNEEVSKATLDKVYYGLSGTYRRGSSGGRYYSTVADGIGASLAYVECHDNMTLYDKLMATTGEVSRRNASNSNDLLIEAFEEEKVLEQVELANANVLGSLSPSFFQIGQEFGRSKSFTDEKFLQDGKYVKVEDGEGKITYFSSDSYNLSDEVNAIDWGLLSSHAALVESFKENLGDRIERGSLIADYGVGDYGYAEVTDTNFMNFDLLENNLVVSYGLDLKMIGNTGTYLYIQNYSSAPVSYQNVTVQPHATFAGIVA